MQHLSAMMRCSLLVVLLALAHTLAWPLAERDLEVAAAEAAVPIQAVEAILTSDVFGPELAERGDRDKRALEVKVIKTLGIKDYILNLLFGKINQAIDHKTALVKQFDKLNVQKNQAFGITGHTQACNPRCNKGQSATTAGPTTTEDPDIPNFERNAVSLVIPSEVFGASFTILNNVGMTLGTLIENSALRTQRFVEALKPIIGRKFGVSTRGRSIRDSLSDNLVERRR